MDEKNSGNYTINTLVNNLGEQVKYITFDSCGYIDYAMGKNEIYLVDKMYIEKFVNEHGAY